MIQKSTLLAIALLFAVQLYAQSEKNESDTLRQDALKVFMQANDYIRSEIPFVNYVRDIKDAQLYIISTSQRTGSGGIEFTYFLIGQHEFQGVRDTLVFATSPDDTFEFSRKQEVNILKMGLMRYMLKTPLARYFDIQFTAPVRQEVNEDPWNSWVFRTRVNGFLNGQHSYNSRNLYGSFSANKITSDWKLSFSVDYSQRRDQFLISEEQISSENRTRSMDFLVVKSLGEHWSVGGNASIGSSSFSNYDVRFGFLPGIEYNLFPYTQSTRRMLKFTYQLGLGYNQYSQPTIYDKESEWLTGHGLNGIYRVVQKWGSTNVGLNWRNFFHDWSMNNLSMSGMIDFRIAKGLNFNFGGGYSIVHDQINLVKGGASAEEILLRRKELETQYTYYTYFGLSYTFGSIYNNVVNPRFRGSGADNMMIMF